eukprot:9468487-Pyramimonas_sp.AAC.2
MGARITSEGCERPSPMRPTDSPLLVTLRPPTLSSTPTSPMTAVRHGEATMRSTSTNEGGSQVGM